MHESGLNISVGKSDTNFLRAVAICLIINSHMDPYYPVKLFATGGMIGNSLFFALSSLGLYLSWKRKAGQTFASWYGSRIIRLYPSVWLTVLFVVIPLSVLTGTFKAVEFLSVIGKFFYPPFWFLQALLLYYCMLYFILRNYSRELWLSAAIITLLAYGAYYYRLDLTQYSVESTPFRIIFYFAIFLWGIYLATIKDTIRYAGFRDYVFAVLCVAMIYLHKYLMLKGAFASLQAIQQLAMFPLLYYLLKIANSQFVSERIMHHRIAGKLFNYLSSITLELFMINNLLGGVMATTLTFPFNVGVILTVNFLTASVIYYTAEPVRKALTR